MESPYEILYVHKLTASFERQHLSFLIAMVTGVWRISIWAKPISSLCHLYSDSNRHSIFGFYIQGRLVSCCVDILVIHGRFDGSLSDKSFHLMF